MFRLPLLATALIGSVLAAPLSAQAQAQTLRLRPDIVVDGDYVRLSDIIENVGPDYDAPVFRAPDLGSTGTIQAARVLAAAREHDLVDIDTSGFSTVVVRRTGRMVTTAEIRGAVRDALLERFSLPADTLLNFDPGMRPFVVESSARGSAVASEVNFNQRSGRFDAIVRVPGSAISDRLSLHVTGSAGEMATVPVLSRSLKRGDVIQESDLGSEKVRRSDIAGDTVFDPLKITGMALKNAVREGDFVREAELMRPQLVERGSFVTLVYESGGITLTIKGKAMANGAKGDIVSVQNTASKKVIEGRVTGPGRVNVRAYAPTITTASAATE